MRILSTIKETYADGPGIRYSIYVAGCVHACPGCHNPQSWNFNQGEELTESVIQRIKSEIVANPLITGITVSGGDPLHPENVSGLCDLFNELDELKKDIWVYTGYTVEELNERRSDLDTALALLHINTLVEGRYVQELRETSTFRGSSNQRFFSWKGLDLCEKK